MDLFGTLFFFFLNANHLKCKAKRIEKGSLHMADFHLIMFMFFNKNPLIPLTQMRGLQTFELAWFRSELDTA